MDAVREDDDPTDKRLQFLRPFGYVESEPVIRRVGDTDVFVGNRLAADPTAHDQQFTAVLSVCSAPSPSTTHYRPLVDGPGNDWVAFEAAVDTARTLMHRDGSLLVHCTAGVSRSVTVLSTALSVERGETFDDALELVRETRPAAVPHPALRELAAVYLAYRVTG